MEHNASHTHAVFTPTNEGVINKQNRKQELIRGVKAAIPIVVGYIPIAISFGVIALQSGIPLLHTIAMSVFIFAGASQFMAVTMISTMGAGAFELIMATFVLNFRHFVMSLSLMNVMRHIPTSWKGFLSFGITDETFTVSSLTAEEAAERRRLKETHVKQATADDQSETAVSVRTNGSNTPTSDAEQSHTNNGISTFFILGLFATSYLAWVSGTVVGGLLSMVIPPAIGASMSIALYAMFIGLLVPAIRKAWKVGLIAIASAALCAFFDLFLNSGWPIVLATVIGSALGIPLFSKEAANNE